MSSNEAEGRRLSGNLAWLVALGLGLPVFALWLPVGFPGGTVEEWLILEQYLRGVSPLETGGHFLRPLVYVPFYIGYALTPGSFVGLNLLHMGFMWGKSAAFYSLLHTLGLSRQFSFAGALLFLLYPADDGQLTLRTVAIQGALMFFLLAVVSLLRFARNGKPLDGAAAVASLAASILVYESSFPLAVLAPLLLLLLPPPRRQRALLGTGLWYVTLGPLAARYAYYLIGRSDTYQTSVLAAGDGGGFGGAMGSLGQAYQRSIWRGWAGATKSLFEAPGLDVLLAIGIGTISILVMRGIGPVRSREEAREELRPLAWVAMISLLVIGLGFSMYLPTSVRESTWRTFFLPSMGGALLTVALARLLSGLHRSPRGVFACAVAALAIPAFVHLSLQHRSFAAVSENQQAVLSKVEAAVPRLHPRTSLLLLFDETDQILSHDAFPFSRYFRAALVARLGIGETNAQVCYPFTERRGEICRLDRHQVSVAHQDVAWTRSELDWHADYDQVVALLHRADGEVRLLHQIPSWYSLGEAPVGYDPGTLVDSGAGFRSPSGALRVEFDEGQFMGGGWSFARTTAHGISYRFMTAPRATVHVPLGPSDYHLRLRIANGVTPELLRSLAARVGDEPIHLEELGSGHFEASLPAELVAPVGSDTVIFFEQDPVILERVQAQQGAHLGLGFDWLHFTPVNHLQEPGEPDRPVPHEDG